MALENVDGSIIIDTKVDESELNHSLNNMQGTVAKASVAMVAAIGAALGSLSVMVMKVGSEYETSLAKTSTLFGETQVDTKNLTKEILELSSTTGESAAALNEGLYQALSAGVEVTEDMTKATGFLDQAVKLAKGGFTSTATAVDIITTTLNAYGDAAGSAQEISDMLIATQNLGKTTVDELASSMGRVIPTAAAYKVSLANLNATYAVMTASGIATAEATTYMRSMFSELADTGSSVAKILKDKTGKSFAELNEEGYSLGEILDILKESVKGNTTEFANLWSSQEAGTGALSIVNGGVEKFNDTLKKMQQSTGATDVAYGKMSDTFEVKGNRILSTLNNIGIQAFDKFQEPLSKAFNTALKTLNDFSVELDRGDLDEGLDQLAESTGDLLEVSVSMASKAIPMLVNGMATVADHSDELIVLTAGLSAGLVTYNLLQKENGILTVLSATYKKAAAVADIAYNSVLAVQTGQMSAAAAAQLALNTVMMANPAILVATGVIALTAAVGAFILTHKESKSEVQENTEKLLAEAEAFQKVSDSADESSKARVAEINNVKSMKNELDRLLDANGNVIVGFEKRADFLVNELAEATGIDIKIVDGQIQGYKELSASIDDTIAKMRAEAILEAHKEEYTEAIQKQGEALTALRIANEEYNSFMNSSYPELEKLREDYAAAVESQDGRRIASALAAKQGLEDELTETKANLDAAQGNYDNYTQAIIDYEQGKTDILNGEYDKVADIYNESTRALEENGADQKTILEAQIAEHELHIDTLKTMRTDANKDTIDAEIKANEDQLAEKRLGLWAIENAVWSSTPAYKEAYKYLSDQGAKAFDENGNLTDEAKKKVDAAKKAAEGQSPAYKAAMSGVAKSGYQGFTDPNTLKNFNVAGKNTVDGVMAGAESKRTSLWDKLRSLAKSALAGFQTGIDSHSPSREFKKLAAFIVPGIVGGIEENEDLATKKMSSVASDMLKSFDADSIANAVGTVENAVSSAQAKLANNATIQSSYQVNSSIENQISNNRTLKGSIDGTIHTSIMIDGREIAVAIAPMVSEEIEFNG